MYYYLSNSCGNGRHYTFFFILYMEYTKNLYYYIDSSKDRIIMLTVDRRKDSETILYFPYSTPYSFFDNYL